MITFIPPPISTQTLTPCACKHTRHNSGGTRHAHIRAESHTAEKEGRGSNIELLRIISTLLILAAHAVQHQEKGLDILAENCSPNLIFTFSLCIWSQAAVRVFVIITSYFMCDRSGIRSEKILRLAFQTWTTCALISAAAFALKTAPFSFAGFVKQLLSPFGSLYWFVPAYIIFYAFLPCLQYAADRISVDSLRKIALLLCAFMPCRSFFFGDIGGPLGDFVFCFFATACLKKSRGNFLERNAGKILIASSGLMFLACVGTNIIGNRIGLSKDLIVRLITRIYINGNLLVYAVAFSLFFLFRRLDFRSAAVNFFGSLTLGVYLISENPLVRNFWGSALHLGRFFDGSIFYAPVFVGSVAAVFTACAALEFIRQISLDRLIGRFPISGLCRRFDSWYVIE